MNHQKLIWRASQRDIGYLSAALKPIRTHEEVGRMLGCSAGLVLQIEASALRKIVRAMTALENNESPNHTFDFDVCSGRA